MNNLKDKTEELERLKNSFLYQFREIQEREQDLRFWKSRIAMLPKMIKDLEQQIKKIEDEQD